MSLAGQGERQGLWLRGQGKDGDGWQEEWGKGEGSVMRARTPALVPPTLHTADQGLWGVLLWPLNPLGWFFVRSSVELCASLQRCCGHHLAS